MQKVTIIYRMCDSVDMLHTTRQEGFHESNRNSARFYDVPKRYLIKKCLSSVKDVMDTANRLDGNAKIAIEFICVHDNCSEEILQFTKNLIPDAKMVASNGNGNMNSFLTCADIANGMVDDGTMVFFLEDDYSFLSGDGLLKSVNMLDAVSRLNGEQCALFLDDYPDRYENGQIRRNTDVVVTPYGHLMRIDSCTFSFLTYVGVVKKHFDLFKGGDKDEDGKKTKDFLELDNTDRIWKTVPLYCPIPALTLHCQLRCHIPPYLNAENIKRVIES